MQVVPMAGAPAGITTDRNRWFQIPSDVRMPFLDNLSTKTPAARTNATLFLCVTCHDPHGVGTALTATRAFSGANDNGFQMLRYKSAGDLRPLCTKCHR
jgi:cytochrome c553